jgi:alkylhydroperoxidase/carboxymuconolactone decarboxylase family protein YurZ
VSVKAKRRYLRTIFLGVACLAALIWAAVDQFGISVEEILAIFTVVLAGIIGLILMAAIVATLWTLAKRIGRK